VGGLVKWRECSTKLEACFEDYCVVGMLPQPAGSFHQRPVGFLSVRAISCGDNALQQQVPLFRLQVVLLPTP
jgi:hypothetical protein